MRRLLFVANVDWFFVSHRLPLALAAREQGYDVHVAATPSTDTEALERHGIQFHPIRVHRGGASPAKDINLFISLLRLYGALKPDIVHHITSKPIIYGSAAARLTGVDGVVNAIPGLGLVIAASGLKASVRRFLVTCTYRVTLPRRHTRTIFQNAENRDLFVRNRLVDPKHAVLIRGSGVDPTEFQATDEPPTPAVVVLASRMLREKGVPEFVEAAKLLGQRGISVTFVLVGRVDEDSPNHIPAAELEEWVSRGWVEWYGHRPDMAEVLRAAHIVCLPTNYGEGVPRVLIEAAASARPIVTTDTPGCRDIVRDGWNGVLIPPKNSEALADAVTRLLNDNELRREMGRNGRALVEREFGLDGVIAQTLEIYRDLSSDGASVAARGTSHA